MNPLVIGTVESAIETSRTIWTVGYPRQAESALLLSCRFGLLPLSSTLRSLQPGTSLPVRIKHRISGPGNHCSLSIRLSEASFS